MNGNMNPNDISELKTDIKHITTFMHTLDKSMAEVKAMLEMIKDVKDMAIETDQRAKSAHNRIDNIEKDYVSIEVLQSVKDRLGRLEKINWFIGSAVGVAIIGAFMKLVLN